MREEVAKILGLGFRATGWKSAAKIKTLDSMLQGED